MPAPTPSSPDAAAIFTGWLASYGASIESGDPARIADHFADDGYWRDVLALTWDYRTWAGRSEMVNGLTTSLPRTRPRAFQLAKDRIAPRVLRRSARVVVEGFFDFETEVGRGTGFARLQLDDARPSASKAWILSTTLQELRGHEEKIGSRRPTGTEYSRNFAGPNWKDRRSKSAEFSDREPQVLIVGGGQAGLTLAARFTQIGVDALIVEANPRIGDNWRNRYHSLTLHNEVWANSLPYIPFPPNWPTFLPKDKVAGWFESYAESMELNVWTSTRFVSGQYDETRRRWTAKVQRADGSTRVFDVPHLVLANGSVSGVPTRPSVPGLDGFQGEVVHSSRFTSGAPYQGKRAIVIGTGNSGHDVAQDLYSNGAAEVTIVQRSPTTVVSLVPSGTMVYALYSEGPPDDIDLITLSVPYPMLRQSYQFLTQKTCQLDQALLDSLKAVGFELDFGEDNTGFHMKYLREGGGYYINVGCSELIAERKIRLAHARDISGFSATAMTLKDGTEIPADLLVLATGYETQPASIGRLLGDGVAQKVGPVWGFNEQGYMKNMWTRTGQEGLWLMGGAIGECRLYSRFLALQIKAELEGLRPA